MVTLAEANKRFKQEVAALNAELGKVKLAQRKLKKERNRLHDALIREYNRFFAAKAAHRQNKRGFPINSIVEIVGPSANFHGPSSGFGKIRRPSLQTKPFQHYVFIDNSCGVFSYPESSLRRVAKVRKEKS